MSMFKISPVRTLVCTSKLNKPARKNKKVHHKGVLEDRRMPLCTLAPIIGRESHKYKPL